MQGTWGSQGLILEKRSHAWKSLKRKRALQEKERSTERIKGGNAK